MGQQLNDSVVYRLDNLKDEVVKYKNIANYFNKCSLEEREHANQLMEYQNLRGGRVVLKTLPNVSLEYLNPLNQNNSNDVLLSFEKTLNMEQIVYKSLLKLHQVAEINNDPQFTDFIEGTYLEEQVNALNEVAKYITQLNNLCV